MRAIPRLDAQQWDRFVAEYWGKKPAILTNVFSSPLLDDEDIMNVLRRGGARMRTVPAGAVPGSDIRDLFYFAGDDPASPVETVDPFPIPEDRNVAEYYSRVRSLLGGQDYSFLVQDVQAYPVLWERALSFLRPLHERVGQPPYVSRCECFLGKYRASPVGVHLDSAHVFTFVLQGRKRFRAWTNDFPRSAPGFASDYTRYLEQAVTLEAGPEDMMYWPPSYWHVAENFTFSVTITMLWEEWDLRIPTDPTVHRWLASVVNERARTIAAAPSGAPRLPSPLQDARDRFVAALQGPAFEDSAWRAWLERSSKLAFNGNAVLPASVTLHDDMRYVANPPVPLEWTRLHEGSLVCAANGASFNVAYSDAVLALLQRIAAPQPWTLAELAHAAPAASTSMIRDVAEHCLRLRAVIPAEPA